VLTVFTLDGENKFGDIPNCEKDNINKYLPNGDYIYDIGLAKCGTERQVRSIARWEFANNGITLKRSDGFEVSILNIDANQLIVEEKSQNGAIAHYEYKAVPTFNNILANVSKPWQLVGLTYNGIDAFSKLIECEKDNKLFFFTSGKYTLDESATTCAPNAPQVMESKWFFADNETQIKIDKTLYTIKEILPKKLVLELVNNNIIYTYESD
jgi:hypothetical protein